MNKNLIQIIINSVLATAVVALFVLFFTLPRGEKKPVETEKKTVVKPLRVVENAEVALPIAYVNMDSFLANYNFAKDASDALATKTENARNQLAIKADESRKKLEKQAADFEKQYNDFQQKLNNNAFLSRERAEQEASRLEKKQQDLQELNAKLEQELQQMDAQLTQELMEENQKMLAQLSDTIENFLQEFNEQANYELILTNTAKDNVLHAKQGYDITAEVVDALNARYTAK